MTTQVKDQTLVSPIFEESSRLFDRCLRLINMECYYEGFSTLLQGMNKFYATDNPVCFTSEFQDYCFNHPIAEVLSEEPTVKQSLTKPRGYSGDADLIDYLYRIKGCSKEASYITRELFSINLENSSCASVRWRAKHLSEKFVELRHNKNERLSCLSVASGHIRELGYVHNAEQVFDQFVALDQDAISNTEARISHPYDFLQIVDKSISYIIRDGFKNQKFDFVYSAGLFDYLNEKVAAKLVNKLYDSVEEDGELLIANFAKGTLERAYMDIFMDWKLIYRDEEEVLEFARLAGIPSDKITLYRDPMMNVIYMRMEK